MSKQTRRDARPVRRNSGGGVQLPGDMLDYAAAPRAQRAKKPLTAKTETQAAYMNAIDTYKIVFGTGYFGTGKTYIAAAKAAEAYINDEIDTIIVTRPAVTADEEYGFLPGELEDKWAPFFAPVRSVLEERLGAGHVEYMLKAGKIQIAPLGFLRGHTFSRAYVLFDEAQNCTPKQMMLFLSRVGEGTKLIIDGDLNQQDIPGPSGLADSMERLRGHPQVGHVHFGSFDDIVRSGLARDICILYSEKDISNGHEELRRYLRG